MFKIKIDEDEYEISFKHYVPSSQDKQRDPKVFRELFGTTCSIHINSMTYPIMVEFSDLSYKDNFNRNTGRKVSLSKALKELFPDDAEIRKLFWDAYYKTRGNKW